MALQTLTDLTQPGGAVINPNSPSTVNYGGPAGFDYSRISALAQPGWTPQQTFDNINANYHSDDRSQVMSAANAWLQAGGQAPPSQPAAAAAPAASSGPDYTSPQGQSSAVQSWLWAGPNAAWKTPDNVAYFTQRINQTGGFTPDNVAYWQQMIASGQTPDQAAGASGAAPAAPTGPTGMNDPNATALFNTLMGIADQSQTIDPNDPVIASQVNAYGAQQTKAARDAQSAVAGAKGGTYDPTAAESRSLQETAGANTSAFQASTMANELAARRTQIQNALSGAAGLLTAEQQMSLQDELTKLEQAQQLLEFQQSQAQQQSQFSQNLEQGAYEFDTNANNNQQVALTS